MVCMSKEESPYSIKRDVFTLSRFSLCAGWNSDVGTQNLNLEYISKYMIIALLPMNLFLCLWSGASKRSPSQSCRHFKCFATGQDSFRYKLLSAWHLWNSILAARIRSISLLGTPITFQCISWALTLPNSYTWVLLIRNGWFFLFFQNTVSKACRHISTFIPLFIHIC